MSSATVNPRQVSVYCAPRRSSLSTSVNDQSTFLIGSQHSQNTITRPCLAEDASPDARPRKRDAHQTWAPDTATDTERQLEDATPSLKSDTERDDSFWKELYHVGLPSTKSDTGSGDVVCTSDGVQDTPSGLGDVDDTAVSHPLDVANYKMRCNAQLMLSLEDAEFRPHWDWCSPKESKGRRRLSDLWIYRLARCILQASRCSRLGSQTRMS